jgi:hypothetical protein
MAQGQACTDLVLQKISGVVYVGSYIYATPGRHPEAKGDILSFNISRARSQPVSTLQISVSADLAFASPGTSVSNNLGERIVVKAGAGDNLNVLPTLFTGYITSVKKRPSLSDARKIILDISAEDEFAKIKYGGKFTRRVKMKDSAYAVITGGQRRQDGNLTLLKRVPAGSKGMSFVSAGSSSSENSPLIKTPDPQNKSPHGSKDARSRGKIENEEGKNIVAEPKHVFANAGSQITVVIRDQVTGALVNLGQCSSLVGSGCLCHINPPPTYYATGSSQTGSAGPRTGLKAGEKAFPISYEIREDTNSFLFKVTGDYPAKVTFVHPRTGATCTIDFAIIPPHDHRDIARGGPAVGSFDAFLS